MNLSDLIEGVNEGKRRHLAKAITLIESNRETDQALALELLSTIPKSNKSIRIGISGVPGVGKSTFIEALGLHLIDHGFKVAVLAVDPSSPTTGGSILGDKTRMEVLSTKKEAFIRPSPTSGTLGGVAKKTRESILLCEAAGYDIILIETVGVGQSEFEVASMVDCFLVMMLPGGGDSLQGIKRGILEITDIMIVNKADGDQEKLALQAKSEYEHAFQFLHPKYEGIPVEFLAISALHNKGIQDTWNLISLFITNMKNNGFLSELRRDQNLSWFKRMVEDQFLKNIWHSEGNKESFDSLIQQIIIDELTPVQAFKQMFTK